MSAPSVLRWVTGVGVVGAALLALGSFALSFVALSEFATGIGLAADLAWVYPLLIDGFIVMATVAAVVMRQRHRRDRAYIWGLLIVFGGISICGNALHALNAPARVYDVWLSAAGSAVPPIALLLASHLLVMMIDRPGQRGDVRPMEAVPASAMDEDVAAPPAAAVAPSDSAAAVTPDDGVVVPAVVPPAPRAASAPADADGDILVWVAGREAAGLSATPSEYAAERGLSVRTAQRRFSALGSPSNVTPITERRSGR